MTPELITVCNNYSSSTCRKTLYVGTSLCTFLVLLFLERQWQSYHNKRNDPVTWVEAFPIFFSGTSVVDDGDHLWSRTFTAPEMIPIPEMIQTPKWCPFFSRPRRNDSQLSFGMEWFPRTVDWAKCTTLITKSFTNNLHSFAFFIILKCIIKVLKNRIDRW